jgi:hypothetical protein
MTEIVEKTHKKKEKEYKKSKRLEEIEQYRKLLLAGLSRSQIMEKMNLSRVKLCRLLKSYKEMMTDDDTRQAKTIETLEKISVIEKKAFRDVLEDRLKPRDFVDINKHHIETLARLGYLPNNKLEVEHTGKINIDLRQQFKLIEDEFRKKEEDLDKRKQLLNDK